jgi:single-strand DNA-binding protein
MFGRARHLLIEGKIQTRKWDDRESCQKKYWTEILVHDLTLLATVPSP